MDRTKSNSLHLFPKISPRTNVQGHTFRTFTNTVSYLDSLTKNQTEQHSTTLPATILRDELESNEISRKLFLKSRERHDAGSLQAYRGPIGPAARLEYFDSFKNLPKVTQRNKYEHLEDSPNVAYLRRLELKQLHPKPFGMIRRSGPESNIDLHCYSMGDLYAEAFSEGLQHVKNLETLNLKGNRLTERGSFSILSKLPSQKLKIISLSDNKIGQKSITKIIDILGGFNTSIKHLNLENTSISDKSVAELCIVLIDNKSITRLNLARNNLTDKSARSIKELLYQSQSLKRLDLH